MRAKEGRPRKRRAKERSASVGATVQSPRRRDNPLLGVALLKVALELKKRRGQSLDEVVSSVLVRMGLQSDELEDYLAKEDLARRLERLKPR